MSTEKELIRICRDEISESLHLPVPGNWKQRDFEYLSDLVYEKSGVRISISTLKRIWKDGTGQPQVFTLDAIVSVLDYPGWSEYKYAHVQKPLHEQKSKPSKTSASRIFWRVVFILLAAAVGVLLYQHLRRPVVSAGIVFKSKKNLPAGVPNTVAFEYDIRNADFDSAFIQHTWDKRLRARVSADNHIQTFIYYYPGFHQARLILNDSIVVSQYVNIKTRGWEALVDGLGEQVPRYVPSDKIRAEGRLYASPALLRDIGIPVSDKGFNVNFFNVGQVHGVPSTDFKLETTLSNSLAEGAKVCQYVQVTLICQKGMISVPVSNPGCTSNVHLHISEVFKSGKNNDLSAFGADLSAPLTLVMQAKGKQVMVSLGGKLIYAVDYKVDLGEIAGFHYKFFGCGKVKDLKLYGGNRLVFADDFR